MINRRRYVEVAYRPECQILKQIRSRLPKPGVLAIVEKDLHLIDAACQSDNAILSSDKGSFRHLKPISHSVKRLGRISVANPESDLEDVLRWLSSGSKPLTKWRLDG